METTGLMRYFLYYIQISKQTLFVDAAEHTCGIHSTVEIKYGSESSYSLTGAGNWTH